MHEILQGLDPGSTVLDLGCGGGSFTGCPGRILRIDRELPEERFQGSFAQADAARLPLADASLDALVSNHSLEHFDHLDQALDEMGRTLKPDAALFVAVPDASTFTDRLYRWLARGGGHLNAFTDSSDLARLIEKLTGLPHRATRPLFSSLSFLNRANHPSKPPRKLMLLGGGSQWSLRLYTLLSRSLDRLLGTGLSFYGWALYFGHIPHPIDTRGWINVCIRCGSAAPSGQLKSSGLVYRRRGLNVFQCPVCSTWNHFFNDRPFAHIRRLRGEDD